MRGLITAIALATCALATPWASQAAETPKPGAVDPRIRTIAYDEEEVVTLIGYLGYQMMIEFATNERIENVSIGDALGWQITPNHKANLLFIKPIDLASPTNMTVVTDRRRYAFELRSHRSAGVPQSSITYIARFVYPPDSTPVQVVSTPAPPAAPEKVNTAYSYTGSRISLPSQVFDDGRFTYFQWPENTNIPALFLIEPSGSESIVNYTTRDGYQVVEQLAPRFMLRNGKEVTVVINDGWRPPMAGALAPRPHDSKTARDAQRAEIRP